MVLEDLFPDIHISSKGVALLAAQITDLEDRCEVRRGRLARLPTRKLGARIVTTRVLLPQKIDRKTKFGTSDYAK